MNSSTRKDSEAGEAPAQQTPLSSLNRRSFLHAVGLTSAALALPRAARAEEKVIQGFEQAKTDTRAEAWKPVSDRKVRVGLAGYGVCKFAAAFGFDKHPNVEIAAVTDVVPDRCEALAKVVGCQKTYPSAEEMVKESRAPGMTPGRAVLVELMSRYLAAVMDPFITLLEIHKLMYFMQEAGEGLRLKYEKASYGPYAKNLRHVLSLVEGHFISGYGDAEDAPERAIELLPGVSSLASEFIESHPDTQARFDRVAKLIHGFETPYGMELLATVHWVCIREGAKSASEAVERTYAWNERKKGFDRNQIEVAFEVLASQGWLN